MKKFLEKVAKEFIDKFGADNSRHIVIVPNKRSEIFLKNYLKEQAERTIWLPEFYTIDEFITKSSGLIRLDPMFIYFELYEIHKKIKKENAMPLEDFLSWAPVILNDFNDIDAHLQDAALVFRHLSEAKAIEKWNPDGTPLTDVEKNYLAFYRSLYTYYIALKDRLKDKGAGFKGMIYRYLFENTTLLSLLWKDHSFSLVGFNALSESELGIFGYLKDNFITTVFLDADEHYLNFQNSDKNSGAGRFIGKVISTWGLKDIKWIGHSLSEKSNVIEVFSIDKQVGQVKFAAKLLEQWLNEKQTPSADIATAIVLADENLLIPLLHSLPGQTEKGRQIPYNITMGYPLSNAAISRFIQQWLNFSIRISGISGNKISANDLIRLISHPIAGLLLNVSNNNIQSFLVNNLLKTGKIYLNRKELNHLFPEKHKEELNSLFNTLLIDTTEAHIFLKTLIRLLNQIKIVTEHEEESVIPLLKVQLNEIYAVAQRIENLLIQQHNISLKALQKILLQLMRRSEINLKGEPLEGVQIMGMLETRSLDFKNLIILSANEGILPKSGMIESFIPFDIRRIYHLPLPKENHDITAYYFFRLLQRAERIALIYNNDSDKFGGGEKSRFILQLEQELPHLFRNPKDPEKIVHTEMTANQPENTVSMIKTQEILEAIQKKAESGFSASSLNVYRNCPLKFYLSEILGLKDSKKIEPDIEFNVFGIAIHGVLEKIYTHFLGQNIDPLKLEGFIHKVGTLLDEELAENYKGGNTKTGKNRLIYEIAKKYIVQFLKYEIGNNSTPGKQIIALEESIKKKVRFGKHKVTLKGFLDRMEKTEKGDIRIIDYKTGKVEPRDLTLNDKTTEIEQLSQQGKDKLFQLLFYAYLYRLQFGDATQPLLGIYSLRMLSSYGLIEAKLPGGYDFFEEYLAGLITEIFDPAHPFDQTENDRICSYCDFKDICNK